MRAYKCAAPVFLLNTLLMFLKHDSVVKFFSWKPYLAANNFNLTLKNLFTKVAEKRHSKSKSKMAKIEKQND